MVSPTGQPKARTLIGRSMPGRRRRESAHASVIMIWLGLEARLASTAGRTRAMASRTLSRPSPPQEHASLGFHRVLPVGQILGFPGQVEHLRHRCAPRRRSIPSRARWPFSFG